MPTPVPPIQNWCVICLTPYAGTNRIRFNGTLSADALVGAGTPVRNEIYDAELIDAIIRRAMPRAT